MLFLLSAPTKFYAQAIGGCILHSTPRLAARATWLAQELRRLEAKDIKKQLHVNAALARHYERHLEDFESRSRTPVPACCLFDSHLFKGLDATSFAEEDAQWANDHVRIFSGLYGLLRPFDEIQPLSLPVTLGTKLTTSKGDFLRDYWRQEVTAELADALDRLREPLIVDCAAEEDDGAYDEDRLPEWTSQVSVEMHIADRRHSAEAMGEFIRWALLTRCQSVEELLEYRGLVAEESPATMRVSAEDFGKDTLVFEEAVGASGWARQLAESGMSKRAFLKEFASGKRKYLRAEINKDLRRDYKRARKRHVVF